MYGTYNTEFEMCTEEGYVYVTGTVAWSGPDVEYTFDCQTPKPGTDMYQDEYMDALPIAWGKVMKNLAQSEMEAAYEAHAMNRY